MAICPVMGQGRHCFFDRASSLHIKPCRYSLLIVDIFPEIHLIYCEKNHTI